MVARSYVGPEQYRYGFNGKEQDSENAGDYDYGFRIYDARLARFLSVDPLINKYPMLTPYQFASNCPISGVDQDGLEYFYAADGTLLGKVGTSTEVRVVNEANVKVVQERINNINGIEKKMNPEQPNHGLNPTETVTIAQHTQEIIKSSSSTGLTFSELNLRATLQALKQTEAGRVNPVLEYNSWYGTGETFTKKSYKDDPSAYAKHPGDDANKTGTNTAAGAYQFLQGSYYGENSLTENFSPASQDQAAVNLMTSSGYSAALSGDMVKFKAAMSGRWISLNHWSGDQLKSLFKKNIVAELSNNSKIAATKGQVLKRQTNIADKVKKQKAAAAAVPAK